MTSFRHVIGKKKLACRTGYLGKITELLFIEPLLVVIKNISRHDLVAIAGFEFARPTRSVVWRRLTNVWAVHIPLTWKYVGNRTGLKKVRVNYFTIFFQKSRTRRQSYCCGSYHNHKPTL